MTPDATPDSSRRLRRFAHSLLAALAAATCVSAGHAQNVDRQLRRPAAHSFLGTRPSATTSFAERSVNMPAPGQLEFDYFVDSEQDHDFLRVFLDSTQSFQMSGRNRGGRVTLPIAAGNHTLRFAYHKDTQGDVGRDVAWVDRLRVTGGGLLSEVTSFDEALLASPSGYTAGGFGGGWAVAERAARRGIRRSQAGAFSGYHPGGVRSASERQLTWPAGSTRNELLLLYLVDSEADHDFFRVFVDGTEKLSVSGAERSDRATIDVGGPGAHTIRFEYFKDESVDEGLDDAVVFHLEARADGNIFEVGGFDDQTIGATPEGWTQAAGADAGWVVAPGVSPRLYAAPQNLAVEPEIDGELGTDYKQATRFPLRDSGNITGARGEAELLFDVSQPALFLILRAEGRTSQIGGEEGELTLYLDTNHTQTSSGGGCAADVLLPGAEDRRLRISYASPAGTGAASVVVAQDVGTCNSTSPWQLATGAELLTVNAAVIEPELDRGFVLLELGVELDETSDIVSSGRFGLGFVMSSANTVSYSLPGHDGTPLLESDVSTWQSVYLENATLSVRRPAHAIFDGVQRRP
jgi:hypothetical protein